MISYWGFKDNFCFIPPDNCFVVIINFVVIVVFVIVIVVVVVVVAFSYSFIKIEYFQT